VKEKKIKNICKIERIISALIIFIGFYQIGKNKNLGTWMVIIGIILIIILPKITKKVLNNKELDTDIKEDKEIEEVVTNDSVKDNEEDIIYKLPDKELLKNDDEINENS